MRSTARAPGKKTAREFPRDDQALGAVTSDGDFDG